MGEEVGAGVGASVGLIVGPSVGLGLGSDTRVWLGGVGGEATAAFMIVFGA